MRGASSSVSGRSMPATSGTNVNLGQILLEERRYEEAIPLLRRAADAEPSTSPPIYNLGSGADAGGPRGRRPRHARPRAGAQSVGYAITFGNGYLEQGAYAEAIGSTGAEPEPRGRSAPRERAFSVVDHRAPMPGAAGGGVGAASMPTAMATSISSSPSGAGERLFENAGAGRLDAIVTSATGLAERRGGIWRGRRRLTTTTAERICFVLRREGSSLFRNEGDGRFSDVTAAAGLQQIPYCPARPRGPTSITTATLDLVVSGQEAADGQRRPRKPGELDTPSSYVTVALQLLRNNGNGTFTDIAAASGLGAAVRAVAIAPDRLRQSPRSRPARRRTRPARRCCSRTCGTGRFATSPASAGSGSASSARFA